MIRTLTLLLAIAGTVAATQVETALHSPMVTFAASRLEQATAAQSGRITATLDPSLGAETFRTRRSATALEITGGDERGLMYGLLDVAEQARLHTLSGVPQRTVRPRFPFRAVKFNLPWMSYRKGESLQLHMATCRDLNFWRGYLDMMAENRFNTLTLWNLHPFSFMIRAKNFPEASGFSGAELAEWQHFWHTLFQMAKDRGIDTYLVNWNIFVSPEFARAHNLEKYHEEWSYFGPGEKSELVERYTRESVTQVLDEYPELTGLGITLGERMGGYTSATRRDWIDRTIIAGMRAAKRPARLIYRAPLTAGTGSGGSTSLETEQLTRAAVEHAGLEQPVWVEFKFNWSHAHSSPRLHIVHGGKLTDTYWNPWPQGLRAVWTMRNEDFFVLRWADPSFIRDTIANNGDDWVGGFIIGSECYIPATDYIHQPGGHRTWTYAWERQWLFYQTWGRLLFDPTTPDEIFAAELERRYGVGRGADLLAAWRLASRVPERIASFYQGRSDGTLYSEGFAFQKSGTVSLIDVDTLIKHPVLDPRYQAIAPFVAGEPTGGRVTPLELAAALDRDAAEVERLAAEVRKRGALAPALECELEDLRSWNALGRYFAAKLRGATALARFRTGHEPTGQKRAVAELESATAFWKQLTASIESHDRPVIPYIFDATFSWSKLLKEVELDVEKARSAN